MTIKAILYDLDGVLCDCVKIHFDAFNMALQDVAGTEILEEEEDIFNGLPTKQKLIKLVQMGRVSSDDQNLIWKKKQEFTKDAIKQNLHYDIVKVKLHKWSQEVGISTACVTNSITDTAKLMLECSGQWEYMDLLISNQMVKKCKPNSEPYVKAMVMLNILPEECVIVEDSDVGFISAINTGAYVYRVSNETEVTKKHLQEFMEGI